jgi:hypothetical protein
MQLTQMLTLVCFSCCFGFPGPRSAHIFFTFSPLWMMTGAAQPRYDSLCTSSVVMRLSSMIKSDMVCIVSSARDVAVRPELSAFLCSLLATGAAPYPAEHTRYGRKVMRLATLCTNRQRCCLPLYMAVRLTPAVDSVQV